VASIVDTSIAIFLRDDHPEITAAVARLPKAPMISVLTRVELEGGIYRDPAEAPLLRSRVDALLAMMPELPFTSTEAEAYGRIVAQLGYSRRRIVDRMIAATAIVAEATLITINGDDFRGIDGLKLETWPSPAP
jgi:predicted nucleic acid-binding protein